MSEPKLDQRRQQLRDLAAVLRSTANEMDFVAAERENIEIERFITNLESHLAYVGRVLAPKGASK